MTLYVKLNETDLVSWILGLFFSLSAADFWYLLII